jgi:hypothetical protein
MTELDWQTLEHVAILAAAVGLYLLDMRRREKKNAANCDNRE